MKIRLLILVVLAGGLVVYLATRVAAPAKEVTLDDGMSDQEKARIRLEQTPLRFRDLPGEEPAEPAELSIRVEVDPTGKKNRLFYYITEAHGYYVETFEIRFYYKPTPDTTAESSSFTWVHAANEYLKSNDTLVSCVDLAPPEIRDIGGSMGTSENWGAEILRYNRARMQNPDPLPPLGNVAKCD